MEKGCRRGLTGERSLFLRMMQDLLLRLPASPRRLRWEYKQIFILMTH